LKGIKRVYAEPELVTALSAGFIPVDSEGKEIVISEESGGSGEDGPGNVKTGDDNKETGDDNKETEPEMILMARNLSIRPSSPSPQLVSERIRYPTNKAAGIPSIGRSKPGTVTSTPRICMGMRRGSDLSWIE
jgi:hypothetical protein